MIEVGLHQPKTRKKDRIHPCRERRKRQEDSVQIDGSYHAWLEDRADKACCCCLWMMPPVRSGRRVCRT